MSAAKTDVPLVQRLTILNHVTLPHDRCHTQMLKAITIATYEAAAAAAAATVPLLIFFASCHFTPLLLIASPLSSFTLTRYSFVSSSSRFYLFLYLSFFLISSSNKIVIAIVITVNIDSRYRYRVIIFNVRL